MSENQKPIIDLTEHVVNIVFDKKNEEISPSESSLLAQDLLCKHQKILGIKVQSVVLPPDYKPAPKTEEELMDWLRSKVYNNFSCAYSIALKYGEKLKVRLEQKKPYINN